LESEKLRLRTGPPIETPGFGFPACPLNVPGEITKLIVRVWFAAVVEVELEVLGDEVLIDIVPLQSGFTV
jgi:hypothetical protein